MSSMAPGCVSHDVFLPGVGLPGHRFVGAAEPESLLRPSSRGSSWGGFEEISVRLVHLPNLRLDSIVAK